MRGNGNLIRADWETHRESLLAVRYAVFVEEQGVPASIEVDEEDEVAIHRLVLDDSGNPVGTARLLPDGRIGRVAVLKSHRRRGIGSRLVSTLVDDAKVLGLKRVLLHAQMSSCPFYKTLGFVVQGEPFEEVGIPHLEMVLGL